MTADLISDHKPIFEDSEIEKSEIEKLCVPDGFHEDVTLSI